MEIYILIWIDPYSTPEYCNDGCSLDSREIKGVFSSIDKLNAFLSTLCNHYGYYKHSDFTTEIEELDKAPFLY